MDIHSLFLALAETPSTFAPVRRPDDWELLEKIQEARGELRLGSLNAQSLSPIYCDAKWPAKSVFIQAFRPPSLLFNTSEGLSNLVHKTFRSSGTSQGADLRSVSRFSKAGLNVYKSLSKKTFFCALQMRFGERFDQRKIRLFSLVPHTSLWPDSSLSQMIAWIGEDVSVVYCTEQSLSECVKQQFSKDSNIIAVIIGTGFHFINSYDAGFRLEQEFAHNYCLVETGGTKGKSRDVSRKEFYRLLCEYGSICLDQIISEYGMSELACQAYDVVSSEHKNVALEDRFFRFPFWAPLTVLVGDALCARSGQGALIVDDLSRIDLHYPIVTEDFVDLFQSDAFGPCFRLHGRIPKAPLKGCSTLAETFSPNVLSNNNSKLTKVPYKATKPSAHPDFKFDVQFDFDKADSWIHSVLKDDEFQKLLSLEFDSQALASIALNDLQLAFANTGAIEEKLKNHPSLKVICSYRPWFVIAPNNHSLVTLSTVYLSIACQIPLKIRLPKRKLKPLERCVTLAHKQNAAIETIANHWTAESYATDQKLFNSAFFVFGTTETVRKIRETLGFNDLVVGFGSRIGITVTPASQLQTKTLHDMIQDNINLRQRGCRSARLNIVLDCEAYKQKQIISQMKETLNVFFPRKIPSAERVALSTECARYRRLGASIDTNLDFGVVLAGIQVNENTLDPLTIVKNMISSYEGVLPVLFLTTTCFHKIFKQSDLHHTDFNLFSTHASLIDDLKSLDNVEVCPLGSMGVQTLETFLTQIEQSTSTTL